MAPASSFRFYVTVTSPFSDAATAIAVPRRQKLPWIPARLLRRAQRGLSLSGLHQKRRRKCLRARPFIACSFSFFLNLLPGFEGRLGSQPFSEQLCENLHCPQSTCGHPGRTMQGQRNELARREGILTRWSRSVESVGTAYMVAVDHTTPVLCCSYYCVTMRVPSD